MGGKKGFDEDLILMYSQLSERNLLLLDSCRVILGLPMLERPHSGLVDVDVSVSSAQLAVGRAGTGYVAPVRLRLPLLGRVGAVAVAVAAVLNAGVSEADQGTRANTSEDR